jgi:anti-sigma factor RsiW
MSHDEVWHLIPWLVNGRAGDAEREHIDAHLRVCDECRNEVAAQRQVMSAIANDKRIDCVPGVAFERLWDRISAEEAPQARRARLKQVRTRSVMKWLAAAVVVEAIGITALTMALSTRNSVEQAAAEYRTVTSSASTEARGTIRAVFAPTLPMSELQRILDQSGLQIVAGPTESGVYTLATTASAGSSGSDSALAGLRANPAVRFAEPIAK